MRGVFSAIVILLAADFLWHVAKTVIDRKMVEASALGEPGTEVARRRPASGLCCQSYAMC